MPSGGLAFLRRGGTNELTGEGYATAAADFATQPGKSLPFAPDTGADDVTKRRFT